MARLVSIDWVAERLDRREFLVIDARRPMKYLSGHLRGAVNVPAQRIFGPDGRLLKPEALVELIGSAGLSDELAPIIYDSPEGQNAAMLAWVLEYLGRTDVYVLERFFEAWKASGREVLYKPVVQPGRSFTKRLRPLLRASLGDIRDRHDSALVDFRSREEYAGISSLGEDRAGHIPGAVNMVWRELGISADRVLKPTKELAQIADAAGVDRTGKVIAYCRSGPRAALGYLALTQLGVNVRLFDASFAEWSRAGLPTEK
jgi:thiosulfate/3-mercaptopyruvate sulfurtransferase